MNGTYGKYPTHSGLVITRATYATDNVFNAQNTPSCLDRMFCVIFSTAASMMLNHGVPSIIVSHKLGHSKISTTLDIKGQLIPEMQNEAVEL